MKRLAPIGLVLLLGACGSSEKPVSASARIAAASGGTVGSAGEARIEVPSGALAADADVSLRSREAEDFASSGFEVAGRVWEFRVGDADHYEFQKPVMIRIPATGDDTTLAHWEGTWQAVAGARREGADLVAEVARFSAYAAVRIALDKEGKPHSTRLDVSAYLAPTIDLFNDSNVYVTAVPDKVRYAANEVYADVPFAVCFPFEVPYRGARVHVYADVLLMTWDANLPEKVIIGRRWDIQTFGVFRLDGREIPSVAWQSRSEKEPKKCYLAKEAPLPTWIGAASVDATGDTYDGEAFYGQLGIRHRDLFQNVSGSHKSAVIPAHFVLEAAEPGWYVYWVAAEEHTVYRGWPNGARGQEKATAQVSAAVLASRVPLTNLAEVDYLFGRAEKPEGAAAQGLLPQGSYQMFRYELPVTLLRNGWVFDRAEIEESDKPYGTVVEKAVNGNVAALGLDFDTGAKLRWSLTMPARIPDNGIADVMVGGGNLTAAKERWLHYEITEDSGWCRMLVDPSSSTQAEEEKEYESSYGDDPELSSYFEYQRDVEPQESGQPLRYRYWGGTPADDDRRATLATKTGEWPALYTFTLGPWRVRALYKRAKDLKPLATRSHDPAPATTVVEDEDDGFWKWFERHLDMAEEVEADNKAIRLQLAAIAAKRRQSCQEWYTLMRREMETPMPGDIADLSSLPSSMTEGSVVFESARMAQLRKAQRDRLRDEVHATRAEQEPLVAEGLANAKRLLQSAEEQEKKSSFRNKPLVTRWREHYARAVDLEKLSLYDAAAWYEPHELPAALAEALKGGVSTEVANVFEAKSLLAQAEHYDYRVWLQMMSPVAYEPGAAEAASQDARVRAMRLLREVIAKNAENGEAKAMLLDLDLQMLRRISAKLEREKQATLADFGQYFAKRGFSANDPQGWWSGAWENLSVAWGTGPITLSAGIPEWMGGYDVPSYVADQVAGTAESAAKNQVTLLSIRRLRKNGIPLDRIANLSHDQLEKALEWRTASGGTLAPERVRAMNRDIQETFAELADLNALAAGDLARFFVEQGKSYYGSILTDESWGEYLGHFFSPKNLLTILGPSAVVNVGGKLAFVRPTTMARMAELGALGQLERGREVVVAMAAATWPRLPAVGRVGSWMSQKGAGDWLRRAVLADQAVLDKVYNASKLAWAANLAGRMGAAVVVFGGVSHLAHESGLPGVGLLVDAFFEFSGEEILFDLVAKSGTPLRGLVGQVDEYGRFLDAQKGQLEDLRKRIDEIERLVTEKKTDIPPLDLPPLREGPPTIGLGIQKAFAEALEAARHGEFDMAGRIIRNATPLTEKIAKRLDGSIARCRAVKAYLATAWEDRVVLQFRTLPRLRDAGDPTPFHMLGETYKTHVGEAIAEGDRALKEGDFAKAAMEYRRAAARGRLERADETICDAIDQRLALAGNAQRARAVVDAWRRETPRSGADLPIGDDEVRGLIEMLRGGAALERVKVAADRTVYRITDAKGAHWYFKTIDSAADRQVELAGPALARALGIQAPAARRASLGPVKATWKNPVTGALEEAELDGVGILMRDVVGKSLLDGGPEPLAVALKDDYVRHRLLRVWLADSDHHLDNMLLGRDGRVWALDFGMGNVTKELTLAQYKGLPVNSQAEMALWALKMTTSDDYFLKNAPVLYGWVRRLDEMIHHKDAKQTVDAIENLCRDRGALRKILLDAGLRDQALEDAVDVLIQRGAELRRLFDRFPLRLPLARLDRPRVEAPVFPLGIAAPVWLAA